MSTSSSSMTGTGQELQCSNFRQLSTSSAGQRNRWCSVWTVVLCGRGLCAIHMHACMHAAVNTLTGINQEDMIRGGCDSVLGILGIRLLVESSEECWVMLQYGALTCIHVCVCVGSKCGNEKRIAKEFSSILFYFPAQKKKGRQKKG